MPSGRSLPKPQTWRIENASAAAFMARSAWTTPSILLVVTIARAPVRLSAHRQFRLPPQQRKQRHDQAGAMRRKHRQHEFDGVRQLNRDDGIVRQSGFDEMRRQRRDRPVGLREGQASGRLAGDALLVERIEQRQCIRLVAPGSVETIRRASAIRWSGSRDHFACGFGLGCGSGLCHQVSGRYPVKAVATGRSIRFQRAIHCS